ncbi:hypothetical protein NEMBOFW57_004863 [Staphylotrichum longicolle]|uniref:Uncharacterized protein n=1 Tax=Staphylotrichum longicolle TaxID=669026 RepID=A0AAD4HZP0_9PEZI|nr:hypothetical protein NEMBOFW57_004863 [Staphylotrichum longicolle]
MIIIIINITKMATEEKPPAWLAMIDMSPGPVPDDFEWPELPLLSELASPAPTPPPPEAMTSWLTSEALEGCCSYGHDFTSETAFKTHIGDECHKKTPRLENFRVKSLYEGMPPLPPPIWLLPGIPPPVTTSPPA